MSQDDSSALSKSQGISQKFQTNQKKTPTKQAVNVFLPRTGIEQVFARDRPRFNENHKEFEPIHQMNVSLSADIIIALTC